MKIHESDINKHNIQQVDHYQFELSLLKSKLGEEKYSNILKKVKEFQVTIPVWTLTPGFKKGEISFPVKGEPVTLEDKLQDVGLIHSLNRSSKSVFLHFSFDISGYNPMIKSLAQDLGLSIDTIGFNSAQCQTPGQPGCELGSLYDDFGKQNHLSVEDIINCGKELGSKSITVWLDDENNSRKLNCKHSFRKTVESLEKIYSRVPDNWKVFIAHKAFESHSYSLSLDWKQSLLYAMKIGKNAFTIVNIEEQLANSKIEEVVSLLFSEDKLGGIHFNDDKYGHNGLMTCRINPYELFLVFAELIKAGSDDQMDWAADIRWIVYPGRNSIDPLEDILQSTEAIMVAYAQALMIDKDKLAQARETNDFVREEEILRNAFRTDVRPLLAESRLIKGAALNPIELFRSNDIRRKLIEERRHKSFEIES